MVMSVDQLREFARNPQPRTAMVLVLDTSGSMSGEPLAQLTEGLRVLKNEFDGDAVAKMRAEIGIVTFGNGGVELASPFVVASEFKVPELSAGSDTPLASGVMRALDELKARMDLVKQVGLRGPAKPIMALMTDGQSTEGEKQNEEAIKKVRSAQEKGSLTFYAFGTESANFEFLKRFCLSKDEPHRIRGFDYKRIFAMLSRTLALVSKAGDQGELPELKLL